MQSACGGSAATEIASEDVGAGEGAGVGTSSALHVHSISLENFSASPLSLTIGALAYGTVHVPQTDRDCNSIMSIM